MSRNTIDYEERRDEILTTARELFLSRGYETTTIQETIDAVGIAKGTFYHYFDSKDNLPDTLVESMMDQRFKLAQAILKRPVLNAAQIDPAGCADPDHKPGSGGGYLEYTLPRWNRAGYPGSIGKYI